MLTPTRAPSPNLDRVDVDAVPHLRGEVAAAHARAHDHAVVVEGLAVLSALRAPWLGSGLVLGLGSGLVLGLGPG